MALGGFASVVAALGRPLDPVRRQRFLALLFLALTQVLASLLPGWLGHFGLPLEQVWRASSLLFLAVATATVALTVVRPLRRLGLRDMVLLESRGMTQFVNSLSVLSFVVLPLNALGFPWPPGFGLYYASLLLSFALGFMLFADVVLRRDAPAAP